MVTLLALITLLFVGPKAEASLPAAGIPVLLPRDFSADVDKTSGGTIYATVDAAGRGSYTVSLDYTADCDGATACNVGTMEGGVTDAVSGSQTVQLQNGITARFEPYACGASCGSSTLMFQYKGVTYRLSTQAGEKSATVATANSLFPPR